MTEYEVQGKYDHGWETVTTETTREEAEARLAEYHANEPQYAHRIVEVHDAEVVVQPFRGKYRVVMVTETTTTVLGTFNARHKAEHEAEQHRQQLGEAESS